MNFNNAGMELLKRFEGCKLEAYQDVGGIWTIGYGSTRNVHPGMVITQAEADDRLSVDTMLTINLVKDLAPCSLNDNQFSAVVCLAFNIGVGNLRKSTLLQKLIEGDFKGASFEFLRWNKVDGKPVLGLSRRRSIEKFLFLS